MNCMELFAKVWFMFMVKELVRYGNVESGGVRLGPHSFGKIW